MQTLLLFFCERFFNVSPRSNNYEFSLKSCFFDVVIYNFSQNDHLFFMCIVQFHTSTPPFGGQREFRGGGGVQKEAISEGWGIDYRGFFPGDLGKIGELFINNSFSVEQAISYFAVTGVSKQVLFFALIIFHLRSAKCFFHGLRDRFLSYNCHRLMNKLPVIQLLIFHT